MLNGIIHEGETIFRNAIAVDGTAAGFEKRWIGEKIHGILEKFNVTVVPPASTVAVMAFGLMSTQ